METINANNWSQAEKELETVETGLSKKISQDIDARNDGHFAVALIKSTANENTKKFEHKVSVQFYSKRTFEKAKSNLEFNGYDKMIILHNPNPDHKKGKVVTMISAHAAAPVAPVGETPAQMEARLKAEFEKKYEGYVPAANNAAIMSGTATTPEMIIAKLKAEFEAKFGPGTDPKVETDEDGISVVQDGIRLTIHFANADEIVESRVLAAANASNNQKPAFTLVEDDKTIKEWTAYAKEKEIDIKGITGKTDIYNAIKEWHADADNK